MGLSKNSNPKTERKVDSEDKSWRLGGISVNSSLKAINTKAKEEVIEEPVSTTPTAKETRISKQLRCPPAPRKRRPALKCCSNGVREFFSPPDLETVFTIRSSDKRN